MCVNPNKGYPIEDKIRPAQPYTADEAEGAKKSSGWCKLTVEAQGRVKRKRLAAEMASKRKEITGGSFRGSGRLGAGPSAGGGRLLVSSSSARQV